MRRVLAGAGIEARRAVRGLVGSAGFSVGIVVVLGVAIAGLSAIATAALALFLRPLPPVDPLTWVGTALLLALVVLAAGLWPAERAARVQPNEALRYE